MLFEPHTIREQPQTSDIGYMQLAKADAGMSYEEVCRAHVESLVAAAAAAAHQTALSTRVASWQAKVGFLVGFLLYASECLACLFYLNDCGLSRAVVQLGVMRKACTLEAGQAGPTILHSSVACQCTQLYMPDLAFQIAL